MCARVLLMEVQRKFSSGRRLAAEQASTAQKVLSFQVLPQVMKTSLSQQLFNSVSVPTLQVGRKDSIQDLICDDVWCKWMLSKSMEAHGQLPEGKADMIRTLDPQGGVAEALMLIVDVNQYLSQSV